MGEKHLKPKSYSLNCIATPPLLFVLNLWIRWLALFLLIILIVVLIIPLIKRKIKKEKIINNGFKLCISGIISIILYICANRLISYICATNLNLNSYDYYPLQLLVFLIALLLNLFLAFKCGAIKKRATIILTIILTIFLIFTCIISILKISERYQFIQQDIKTRNKFQVILNELPKPSNIEKQIFSDPSVIYYYISMDTNELVNFYKSNISSAEWKLLLEKESDYDYALYYQKTNENVWIRLSFYDSSKLTISFYESNPLTLSEDGNWYYMPHYYTNDLLGGCGDFTLY